MTPIQPILSVHTSSFMLILLPQNSVRGGGVTQITMDPISYRIAHLKKSTPKLRPTNQDLLMNRMTGGWWFQPTPSEKYDRQNGKNLPQIRDEHERNILKAITSRTLILGLISVLSFLQPRSNFQKSF